MSDLLRDDVIPFMSNPDTEAASYAVYRDTILETARLRGLDVRSLERRLSGDSGAIVFGERIHHREAPQAVAEGRADVAMVYYHLALRYARIFTGAVRTGLRRMGPYGRRCAATGDGCDRVCDRAGPGYGGVG